MYWSKRYQIRHLKIFPHPCMDGRAHVCLSGLKSWITFDRMKGYWWNYWTFFKKILSTILTNLFSLHARLDQSERIEVKGIKKAFKKFSPSVYGWEGARLSVRIKKLNNFWWNERILMKFSGAVQLWTSNFLAAVDDCVSIPLQK